MFGEEKASQDELDYLKKEVKELRSNLWDMEQNFRRLTNHLGLEIEMVPATVRIVKIQHIGD